MIIEIKIPSPGESITEVEIANWLVEEGDYVQKDQELAEIESDKATLPLIAEKAGKISQLAKTGEPVPVGSVACTIDTSAEVPPNLPEHSNFEVSPQTSIYLEEKEKSTLIKDSNKKDSIPPPETPKSPNIKATPVAKKMMEQNNLNVEDIINGLKKITTKEVEAVIEIINNPESAKNRLTGSREVEKEKMSSLRRKISERLVSVKNETAMLTTFNEVDMTSIMELRSKYQKLFIEKYGIKLGFMSFFTKAVTKALNYFPKINSYIDGEDIITPMYNDIGIAVQTNKGLMVPVIRNTETLSIPEIEISISEAAKKARSFKLTPQEMSGGTFTITNGGVFGSLLSTPIINPPQSGILGMHNIQERPIAYNGKVVIRPMMYIALSYDHRIVDGKDSVSFLVKVKELLETPFKMLLKDQSLEKTLLGL